MSYAQLYYHLVWSTYREEPLLTARVEPIVYDAIRWKAVELDGLIFALNGTATHVHVVAGILPWLSVAAFVAQLKNAAAARFNRLSPMDPLQWAEEYGVLTLDGKRMPHVMAYVERQKPYHAAGTLIPILERTNDQPVKPITLREMVPGYAVEDEAEAWWQALLMTVD
ncbi:MAG: transposase [Candidatus Promineofilum sp.]|nr:transposase [Promineifilum sp.]